MGRRGRAIRSLYPRPQHGQAYEALDLSEMRSPGAVYREPRPPRPYHDPLLYTETAYPRAPEPYREDAHYPVLDRWPYLKPTEYEPAEPAWEYDQGPHQAMFDGRAGDPSDHQPRERPLTYEESLRRLDLLSKLEAEAAADQDAYAARGDMPGDLEALGQVPQDGDEVFLENTAPADVANGPDDLSFIDSLAEVPGTMPEAAAYGGLEQILLGQEPQEEPAGPDPWASMALDGAPDDLSLAEHAFDRQLEDIAHEFQQQEQAFAEPDWGAGAMLPGFEDPALHEPPDPQAPLMMPPGPGPM